MVVSSLGSGSNGNAFLIEVLGTRVLLDAGIPIRTMLRCLAQLGVTPADIDAVLISHEHVDHVRALGSLSRRGSFPVLATRGTIDALDQTLLPRTRVVRALEQVSIGGLVVSVFPVAHDAREPVGFAFEAAGVTVTVMTDLGEVSEINAEFACRADHLVIESNYDEHMLRTGSYPAHLKRRIRSSHGHLSNDDCSKFLLDVVSERTRGIWLSHLSESNNRPEIAVATAKESLARRGHAREITALPRYDGTVLTWRSGEPGSYVHQSSMSF